MPKHKRTFQNGFRSASQIKRDSKPPKPPTPEDTKPDWTGHCENCGQSPIVPITGMCGPCTFGEADTAGGNW